MARLSHIAGLFGGLVLVLSTQVQASGDPEWGAYLSGECVTCHHAKGEFEGIPSITNWPEEEFVAAMQAYKSKTRHHPIMELIAGRLADDEIAALAAYFAQAE